MLAEALAIERAKPSAGGPLLRASGARQVAAAAGAVTSSQQAGRAGAQAGGQAGSAESLGQTGPKVLSFLDHAWGAIPPGAHVAALQRQYALYQHGNKSWDTVFSEVGGRGSIQAHAREQEAIFSWGAPRIVFALLCAEAC